MQRTKCKSDQHSVPPQVKPDVLVDMLRIRGDVFIVGKRRHVVRNTKPTNLHLRVTETTVSYTRIAEPERHSSEQRVTCTSVSLRPPRVIRA